MNQPPLVGVKARHYSAEGHYLEAERCLAFVDEISSRGGDPTVMALTAQVHATLATCTPVSPVYYSVKSLDNLRPGLLLSFGQNLEEWELNNKEDTND